MVYYIVPDTKLAMVVDALDKEDALESFVFYAGKDVDICFKAVTKEEYKEQTGEDISDDEPSFVFGGIN